MIRIPIVALVALVSALALAQEETPEARAKALVGKLSGPDVEGREKAVEDLIKIGPPALDALRRAAKSGGPEVKNLANQAIEGIEWTGLKDLKKYVGRMYADGSTVEKAKVKALAQWFPDTQFYEVKEGGGGAAAGRAAAIMGMQQAKSNLFAVSRFKEGFTRIVVQGINCRKSFSDLVRSQRIVLKDENTALDFALAFLEVQGTSAYTAALVASMGGGGQFEQVDDGWKLESGGNTLVFETDKEGVLTGVRATPVSYLQRMGLGNLGAPVSKEQQALEMEKLRLEIELLKRQLKK